MSIFKSAVITLFFAFFLASAPARASGLTQALQADWQNVSALYPAQPSEDFIVVDVSQQILYLLVNGQLVNTWPVSTATRGTGAASNSEKTPLGVFAIVRKTGAGQRPFEVLNSAGPSGRVAKPVYAADDPAASANMTARLLALQGLQPGWNEGGDVDTEARHIFIHGTANLGMLGQPASLGCVQMAPWAVIALFRQVPVGTLVLITTDAESPIIPGLGASPPPIQIARNDDNAG